MSLSLFVCEETPVEVALVLCGWLTGQKMDK